MQNTYKKKINKSIIVNLNTNMVNFEKLKLSQTKTIQGSL